MLITSQCSPPSHPWGSNIKDILLNVRDNLVALFDPTVLRHSFPPTDRDIFCNYRNDYIVLKGKYCMKVFQLGSWLGPDLLHYTGLF